MKSQNNRKQQHELAVIQAALREHNSIYACDLKVMSRPDPPDAILSNGDYTTWLEHTDAFFSEGWARALGSSVAFNPSPDDIEVELSVDVNKQLAIVFCQRVLDKNNKESYKESISQYGPGILVVGLESPWLNKKILKEINQKWRQLGKPDISATFNHVYIGYRDKHGMNHAIEWRNI